MKLLYLSESIGLSETFIRELSKGLSHSFNVTHLVSEAPYYNEGINTTIIDYDISPKKAKWLSYILENRGKKILYNLRKKKASKKLESYCRSADAIFVDYGTTAVLLLPILERYHKPLIVHFHGVDITSHLNSPWYKDDLIKLYQAGTYFITASLHVKRLLVLDGCPEEKIKTIRYGVEIPQEALKDKISYLEKQNDFIFIGRLTPKKSPLALIHAFNIVSKIKPESNLHIVGDGPLMDTCKELIRTLKLQNNIKLFGALPHLKAMNLLKNSKIYVQHSVTSLTGDQEGFAISLAEAAIFEMPVVSTLHNGIPENVINGETGFLVREFDYETMAEKMIELINNPELAEDMGKRGKLHISNLCSTEKRVYEISQLIKDVVLK